jgi:cell division protein FtsL
MMRMAIAGGLVIAGLAIGVYRAKLGAETTSERIETIQTDIAAVEQQINVLKAEEAYLSRPERIGPLAREKAGLAPTAPDQFTAPEMISRRLGEERSYAPVVAEGAASDAAKPAETAPAP